MNGDFGETAFLGLGGNIGDPARAMAQAIRMLDAEPHIEVVAVSSLYRTAPWGNTDQPDFLNAAAAIATTLTPARLLEVCLAAERRLKRVRAERWGPRAIDIDILTFGSHKVSGPGLVVPHPRLLERAFVLVPFAELAPDHVIDGRSLAEWATLADRSGIDQLSGGRDWWKREPGRLE